MKKRSRPSQFQVTGELVKVVEVEALGGDSSDVGALSFRVELFRIPGRAKMIRARVWRKEFYRAEPTFPQKRGKPSLPASDEVLLVEETSIFGDPSSFEGKTARTVLSRVLAAINERLAP